MSGIISFQNSIVLRKRKHSSSSLHSDSIPTAADSDDAAAATAAAGNKKSNREGTRQIEIQSSFEVNSDSLLSARVKKKEPLFYNSSQRHI
jgi:hypothetical protein